MWKYEIRDIRREEVEEAIHQWVIGRNAERNRAITSRKLFDGITDVVAFSQPWGKERFYEISFPKFVPEFTKVRIYGHNLGDVTVKIRKRGEWLTLKPDQVEKGDFMRAYTFKEKVRTVKIRFEFPKPQLELYEIELLK